MRVRLRSERAQEHLAAVVGVLQPGGGEGAAVAREADLLVVRGERGRVVERLERDDALLGARLGVGIGLGLGFRVRVRFRVGVSVSPPCAGAPR